MASIKVTNNNNITLSGLQFVFNVTGPQQDSRMVTLGIMSSDSYSFSGIYYGSMVDDKIQYVYEDVVLYGGVNIFLIRGRYNVPGSYDWEVAIFNGYQSYY